MAGERDGMVASGRGSNSRGDAQRVGSLSWEAWTKAVAKSSQVLSVSSTSVSSPKPECVILSSSVFLLS